MEEHVLGSFLAFKSGITLVYCIKQRRILIGNFIQKHGHIFSHSQLFTTDHHFIIKETFFNTYIFNFFLTCGHKYVNCFCLEVVCATETGFVLHFNILKKKIRTSYKYIIEDKSSREQWSSINSR